MQTITRNLIRARLAALDAAGRERGDVPGWVLITLMTAGLVTVLWAVAALLLVLAFAAALSLFTSVWGETTRDMRFALGQLFSVWYLLTPVLYPLSDVPEAYRTQINDASLALGGRSQECDLSRTLSIGRSQTGRSN